MVWRATGAVNSRPSSHASLTSKLESVGPLFRSKGQLNAPELFTFSIQHVASRIIVAVHADPRPMLGRTSTSGPAN